jgi:hypothetical protein
LASSVQRVLQVAAGAERLLPGAREDPDQRGVVVAEPGPRRDELAGQPRPDRVHPLRPVDRDHRDRPVLLVDDVLEIHGAG